MPRALIITVGGSDTPIVEAIKQHRPDFIYFICTEGNDPTKASSPTVDGQVVIGKPKIKCPCCNKIIQEQETRENIIKQAGYSGDYKKIEIQGPDNYNEIYEKTKAVIDEAKSKGYEIIADFTGGTKTMTAVLAMLSVLDFDIKPSLTTGKRTDTVRVAGDSIPVLLNVSQVRFEKILEVVGILVSNYLYNSAYTVLKQAATKIIMDEKIKQQAIERTLLLRAFSCWDSFDYKGAYDEIRNHSVEFGNYLEYLLKILNMTKNTGYEPVFDLIMNAERQAHNGFFDNAVARLYRALELFAQIRLKKEYCIDTSALEKSMNKLKNPERWEKKKNEKGEIKIGLQDDYELLFELEDFFGTIYNQQKEKLQNILQVRNFSKLAHGDQPVSEENWKNMLEFTKSFIKECCDNAKIKVEYLQLPTKI